MNFFSDGSIICASCKQRFSPSIISISVKNIGLCRECCKLIEPVPLFNPMEGSKNVKFYICGYYYDDVIKKLIHRYKFNSEYSFGDLFSEMLYERIKDIPELRNFDFITSVPISRRRLFSRGYNQSELIARTVSEKLDIPYTRCIYKHKHTLAQSLLKKNRRITNIKGAFIADTKRVANKKILLFDDIITTGSTMNECAGELYDKGAYFVAGLSFAVTRRKIISEALSIWGNGF